MSKFNNRERKGWARQGFTVPATSGNYANERITFGQVAANLLPSTFEGFCLVVEDSLNAPFVASCSVEVWVARFPDATTPVSALTDADYTFAGTAFRFTSGGLQNVTLNAYHLFQIRVKSGGGLGGTQFVSVTGI